MSQRDLARCFKEADDVWDACRGALRHWHDLDVLEDDELAAEWLARLEGFGGQVHPAVRELTRFAAMLQTSDGHHDAIGLTPQILPLRNENAVTIFHDTEEPSILYGFDPEDTNDPGPKISGFDFDRIPEDLDEDDPADDLRNPERWTAAPTPGTFALIMLHIGHSPEGAFQFMAEHSDKERFDDAVSAVFGAPASFEGVDIWGGPGLLLIQRWCYPFDYRVDILALSRTACAPLEGDIIDVLGLTPRVFDHHDWPG